MKKNKFISDQIEKERNLDIKVSKNMERMACSQRPIEQSLMIMEMIHKYKKEIFEVKMQIKDLNRAYVRLRLPNSVSTNNILDAIQVYENILSYFRDFLLEEKMSEEEKEEEEEFMLE